MTREQKIEAEARKIVLNYGLDPDKQVDGHPAWRIPWILDMAASKLNKIVNGCQ